MKTPFYRLCVVILYSSFLSTVMSFLQPIINNEARNNKNNERIELSIY